MNFSQAKSQRRKISSPSFSMVNLSAIRACDAPRFCRASVASRMALSDSRLCRMGRARQLGDVPPGGEVVAIVRRGRRTVQRCQTFETNPIFSVLRITSIREDAQGEEAVAGVEFIDRMAGTGGLVGRAIRTHST